MSSTDRQSRLLVAEDWKAIYQSFRNADFQSYDFDSLRRTMIQYLRQNYPEDFNDYIESSEYLALIDMIAFLGQNLSFRIDLNARENFLETAERRESILRLARMLAYNPKRNQCANGLLKVSTVKTTESVFDSNGINLGSTVIKWNDNTNVNYFEQFIKILNSALPVQNSIGNPLKTATIDNVTTQKYKINGTNTKQAVYPFSKRVEGSSTRFEVVSVDIQDDNLIEEPPLPGNNLSFLFRDDGQGAASINTGFFLHFRQGKLEDGVFQIASPTPNQAVAIDSTNINDSDVWLYSIDSAGVETAPWSKIQSVEGNNIIYNNLFQGIKDVFAVNTRVGDRISLIFSDGVFGNLPTGNFKTYYRTSANRPMTVSPTAIGKIDIDIPYESRNGTRETITIGLELKTIVSNGSSSETNNEIRTNAPATYYTQNRLITGEDYNIGPLAISQDIIKTKSTNRISAGVSRYYDLKDVSGKYSNTDLFSTDGVIYKEEFEEKVKFGFTTQSDIEGVINNTIEKIITNTYLRNFYLDKFPRNTVNDLNVSWKEATSALNYYTGNIQDIDEEFVEVGSYTENSLKFLEAGSLVKFIAPDGKYFDRDNNLVTGSATEKNSKEYIWSKVASITEDGTDVDATGFGAIIINDKIPTGALLNQIIPKFNRTLSDDIKTQIIDQTFTYNDYALRYNIATREWVMILSEDIDLNSEFAIGKTGDISGQNLDASWLIRFKSDGDSYTVYYRNLQFVFESDTEIKFFFDSADKVYDTNTGKTYRDKIDILNINNVQGTTSSYTRDFTWAIYDAYRDVEGYVDTKKIVVTFLDSDDDGVVDDPELFDILVDYNNPEVSSNDKLIFQQRYYTSDGVENYKFFANTNGIIKIVQNEAGIGAYSAYNEGQIFYLLEEKVFKKLNKSLNNTSLIVDYKAYQGRSNLKFHYAHVADSNYRIDPAVSNLIDTFVLTKSYDTRLRTWLKEDDTLKPLPPSNDELYRSFGAKLNAIKSISDEIIYHPSRYKILFGNKANETLQVTFKIVKNAELVTNNNELKADIISAIDRFFALENWDFGETFYFQEMSTYVLSQLSPKLTSFLMVPKQEIQAFGSLFQIKSEPDEILISGATVDNIEIIDEITAASLQASGAILQSSDNKNFTAIQSSESTNTTYNSNNTSTSTSSTSSSSSSSSSSSGSSSGSSGGGYSY
jgi:hypothetical protein